MPRLIKVPQHFFRLSKNKIKDVWTTRSDELGIRRKTENKQENSRKNQKIKRERDSVRAYQSFHRLHGKADVALRWKKMEIEFDVSTSDVVSVVSQQLTCCESMQSDRKWTQLERATSFNERRERSMMAVFVIRVVVTVSKTKAGPRNVYWSSTRKDNGFPSSAAVSTRKRWGKEKDSSRTRDWKSSYHHSRTLSSRERRERKREREEEVSSFVNVVQCVPLVRKSTSPFFPFSLSFFSLSCDAVPYILYSRLICYEKSWGGKEQEQERPKSGTAVDWKRSFHTEKRDRQQCRKETSDNDSVDMVFFVVVEPLFLCLHPFDLLLELLLLVWLCIQQLITPFEDSL